MKQLEQRSYVTELRVDPDARKIIGHAAVFDKPTDICGSFMEVIAPGAFSRSLKEGADVRALMNHNPDLILGRVRSKTLTLEEDKTGLLVHIDPPDTNCGRDVMRSIERGDIDGMSFAFRAVTEEWEHGKDGKDTRTLRDVDLIDVSPVTFPAYQDTDVAVRSLEAWLDAETRPYPNEHAARLRDPDDCVRVRQLWAKEGIRGLGGPLKSDPSGSTVEQALRFKKDKWSVAEAKAWLKEHDYKVQMFEPASEEDSSGVLAFADKRARARVIEMEQGA